MHLAEEQLHVTQFANQLDSVFRDESEMKSAKTCFQAIWLDSISVFDVTQSCLLPLPLGLSQWGDN
jgi:hypothetical protein